MEANHILDIVKQDLIIKSNVRDEYLTQLITGCKQELNTRGVNISDSAEDSLLLADYVAFRYRHRTDGAPIPQNLQLRINNKKCKRRIYRD